MSGAGLPQLVAVLHEYQATFDHPGWTAPGQGTESRLLSLVAYTRTIERA
jgi:hypothetical protein